MKFIIKTKIFILEKPQFDKENLPKEIKVKAGEKIHVQLPFFGSPAPIVSLTKNGAPVVDGKNK